MDANFFKILLACTLFLGLVRMCLQKVMNNAFFMIPLKVKTSSEWFFYCFKKNCVSSYLKILL